MLPDRTLQATQAESTFWYATVRCNKSPIWRFLRLSIIEPRCCHVCFMVRAETLNHHCGGFVEADDFDGRTVTPQLQVRRQLSRRLHCNEGYRYFFAVR